MTTNLTTIESFIQQEDNLLNSPSTSFSPFPSDYLTDAAIDDNSHDSLYIFSQLIVNLPNGSRVSAQSLDLLTLKSYCGHAEVAGFAKVLLHLIYSTSQNQIVSTVIGQEQTGTNEDAEEYIHTQFVLTLIFLVVGVLGVVGNWLTVLVICKTSSLHTPTNYLLASLACSDLFLILVGVPFDLFYLWTPHSAPAFHGFCELTSISISWFTFNSILTILALSVERLVAIRYPFHFRSCFHSRNVIGGIIGIWVSAFFPSLYIGLQFKPVLKDFCGINHQLNNGLGSCDFVGWNAVHFEYTFEVMLLLTFVLPVLFIFCCYVLILDTLSQVTSSIHLIHVQLTHRRSSTSAGTTILEENNNNCSARHRHMSTQLRSQKAHKTVLQMLGTIQATEIILIGLKRLNETQQTNTQCHIEFMPLSNITAMPKTY
uniref:G-protein coupled receptors family 1 profile domain-containing protein n=1 Tax=Ditylenchus dipsaci TaxID=166011 RepID=A0A915DX52_9BILA